MRCGWTARPPRGCRHYSRDTRYWTAARRCAGRTAPCSWMAGAAAGRCSAGPSWRVSSRRWTTLGPARPAPRRSSSALSPSSRPRRPRSSPRRRVPSGRARRSSRRARRRATRSGAPPTRSARPPRPPPWWSGCPSGSPRWRSDSADCTRSSSATSWSASGWTSVWGRSAPNWSTWRHSRRRPGSSGCAGRWRRRRWKRGWAGRAAAEAEAARTQAAELRQEIAASEHDAAALDAQRAQWEDQLKERRLALAALEAAAVDAEEQVRGAEAELVRAEGARDTAREALEAVGQEEHHLELERTGIEGRRRALAERVAVEWRKPLDRLLVEAPEISGDVAWLRQENERLQAAIEAVGPVNALAVEEHAEETQRLEFLMTQRDDLVAARNSLQQAAREIDQTAKALFLDAFAKVRENFRTVFQTLFGGGECDVRLGNEDDPLESEIEIHAAPRGKRTQRIHLLSSGERTLVAVSLLFAIFLARPSPFCLLDEVDAPLDDANVGRYVRLLSEFKDQTQFIVITHNPRTMQAADAVYGVTMQEPGVSTIVGVRLGQMEPVYARCAGDPRGAPRRCSGPPRCSGSPSRRASRRSGRRLPTASCPPRRSCIRTSPTPSPPAAGTPPASGSIWPKGGP